MKKISTLLAVAVAIVLAACNGNKSGEAESVDAEPAANSEVKGGSLKIAFVLIDTLTSQYERCKELEEEFAKKRTNAESTVNSKGKSFAEQVQEFQRKAQSNQLTQQQYESEQARLAKLQQDVQALSDRLSASLQEEYATQMKALTDTIQSFMKSYAKQKGYDFILCKSSGIDNVLYANDQYDITNEVVTVLNKRYGKEKKADKKK